MTSRGDGAPRRGAAVLEGRYRVDGVLARGGMSTVHHGMDLRLDRPVAIKVMDPELAGDPTFVRRFEREARAAARLSHPGVVAVHDQGRDADGTVFLVLELVDGGTLRDVLREYGKLRPAAALTAVEQIVTALGVAHAVGLVHRDVKPENVLVPAGGGPVKVADFGLVGAVHEATDDGPLLGTVAYLAPEQVTGGDVDARTDLYSAGIVLFELLTGAPPYGGADPTEVAHRHAEADVPPPSSHAEGVPPALDRLVRAATARRPERRPASVGEFLTLARDARRTAGLGLLAVPRPPLRRRVPPPRDPLRGTRRLDLDGDRHSPDDTPGYEAPAAPGGTSPTPGGTHHTRADSGGVDGVEGVEGDDPAAPPTPAAPPAPTRARVGDDVEGRIAALERRRARTRSRRWVTVWVALVGVATVVAGLLGWGAGLPG